MIQIYNGVSRELLGTNKTAGRGPNLTAKQVFGPSSRGFLRNLAVGKEPQVEGQKNAAGQKAGEGDLRKSSFAQALRRRKDTELEHNFPRQPGEGAAEPGTGAEDPRPDLAEDSALWRELLRRARELDDRVYEVLHGFRCLGTRIEARDGKHRLVPLYDPRLGWNSEAEYGEAREKWLKPLGREITALLQALDGEAARAGAKREARTRRGSSWGKCLKCGMPMWVGEEGEGICAACEAKAAARMRAASAGTSPSPSPA